MNNLILIGYMGSGKTTLGKRLSYRLQMPYEDTDKMIVREQGIAIDEIFATKGEEEFRDMETRALKKLLSVKQNYVISTGGGLVLREENRKVLRKLGTTIYLRAKPETIYERLKDDTTRPLLQGEDPEGTIRSMMEKRSPMYEMAADIVVDVDEKTYEQLLVEIRGIIKK